MAHVYPNQIVCANKIVKSFFEHDRRVVLLLAQMQMGKSGTYWDVIVKALTNDRVNHVYLICGNREKSLYHQVVKDMDEYLTFYESKKLYAKITLVWGTSLSKSNMNVKPNSLIVWDEAHYAQSVSNAPYRFMERNGLVGLLDGSYEEDEKLMNRNIRLLTVSATPFSELRCGNHKVVRLKPSEHYFGVEQYLKNDLVHPSFPLTDNKFEAFCDLLRPCADDTPSYVIVRTIKTACASLVARACRELGFKCRLMNNKVRTFHENMFQRKPDVPTVVVVTGMLRMGKVLHKEFISMVFEAETLSPADKGIDTGLQGLFGRVCGHSLNGFNIRVYIQPSMIEAANVYVDTYDTKGGPMCNPAMNIRKNSDACEKYGAQCDLLKDLPEKLTRSLLQKKAIEAFPNLAGYTFKVKNALSKTNVDTFESIKNGTYASKPMPGLCVLYKHCIDDIKEVYVVRFCGDCPSVQPGMVYDKCVFKKRNM